VNLHHELTHVPLLVYRPGLFEGGVGVPTPVSLCDLYPTILDALDLEYDAEHINGVNLLAPPPDRPIFAQRCS